MNNHIKLVRLTIKFYEELWLIQRSKYKQLQIINWFAEKSNWIAIVNFIVIYSYDWIYKYIIS